MSIHVLQHNLCPKNLIDTEDSHSSNEQENNGSTTKVCTTSLLWRSNTVCGGGAVGMFYEVPTLEVSEGVTYGLSDPLRWKGLAHSR